MSEWKKAIKKPITMIKFREVKPLTDVFLDGGWYKGEVIKTTEGILIAVVGRDFIIKGVNGEIYPIKKEIFYKTYEVIEDKSEWKPDHSQIMTIEKKEKEK